MANNQRAKIYNETKDILKFFFFLVNVFLPVTCVKWYKGEGVGGVIILKTFEQFENNSSL